MSELHTALAEAGVRAVSDADVIAANSVDHAHLVAPGRAAALVRARSTAEVQAVLRVASELRVPVVPQGARTGLAGSATAVDAAILLDVSGMNEIVSIDPVDRTAVCQPGVINADISRAAAEHGLRYAPDPGSWRSRRSAATSPPPPEACAVSNTGSPPSTCWAWRWSSPPVR
ncbi:hypothetical protein GCM10029992_11410 [Glycomyces albus]